MRRKGHKLQDRMAGTAGHPVLKPVASAYFASTMGPSILAGNSASLLAASSALGRWGNEVPTIKQLLILLNISTWDEAAGKSCFCTLLYALALFLPDSGLYSVCYTHCLMVWSPCYPSPTQAKENS